MPIIKSTDYHDFVIRNGKFIGEFEQMYQQVDDPWGCVKGAGALKNDLLIAAVTHVREDVRRALDIGCGLGGLTARLRQALPAVEWHGCDISSTAVAAAAQQHKEIHFFTHDLTTSDTLALPLGTLDLVTMAEVMWYVLPFLSKVLAQIYQALRPGGHLLILQYFLAPEHQEYGKDLVAGPDDLLKMVTGAGFRVVEEVHIGPGPSEDLLLWAEK
jgi:SAM-dependent methyltransferase